VLPAPPEGLRHWRPEDAPALAAAWSDPDVTAWNPPPPDLDPGTWIAGVEERWARRLALDLVILPPPERADRRAGIAGRTDRADPPVAGEVGLSGFTSDPARAELGVWVADRYRRRGVAATAVASVTAWALTELALDQVWARTDPRNAAAAGLFRRLGWQRHGESAGTAIWSVTTVLLR
jgi:RimJ/RimL family protein N-acetyltransferase